MHGEAEWLAGFNLIVHVFVLYLHTGSKLPAKGNGTDSPQGTENGPESPSNPALTRTNRGSKCNFSKVGLISKTSGFPIQFF